MPNSRDKGARGERELESLLRDQLGDIVSRRRLGQARDGGHDLDVGGIVVECKRAQVARWGDWINQVRMAASRRRWAIAWRRNRGPWLITMEIDDWCYLMQEAQSLVKKELT